MPSIRLENSCVPWIFIVVKTDLHLSSGCSVGSNFMANGEGRMNKTFVKKWLHIILIMSHLLLWNPWASPGFRVERFSQLQNNWTVHIFPYTRNWIPTTIFENVKVKKCLSPFASFHYGPIPRMTLELHVPPFASLWDVHPRGITLESTIAATLLLPPPHPPKIVYGLIS